MKFTCDGFKSVNAESMGEAANIFANRAARREYGRSASCLECVEDERAQDGSCAEYEAFIGISTSRNKTTGRHAKVVVFRA